MFRRHGPCIALCLCFFLVGIVIGGCLIGSLPLPNRIHLIVMPNHSVHVSPEVGDQINWVAYGPKTPPPTITFSSITGRPCQEKDPANTCLFNSSRTGVFIYQCGGSADCDPGVGPSTTTGTLASQNLFKGILGSVARLLEKFVFAIDRALGFLPTPIGTGPPAGISAPASPMNMAPIPSGTSAQPALAAPRADHDGEVGCVDNGTGKTDVKLAPPNIDKTIGGTIIWEGSDDFTLAIDQTICKGDTSVAGPYQECTLVGGIAGRAYTYAVTDNSCTNVTTNNTYTITPH